MFCYKFFVQREISEVHELTGRSKILQVHPKNFEGEKHAKFGPISDDFEVRRRISPKRMKIFKFGFLFRLP